MAFSSGRTSMNFSSLAAAAVVPGPLARPGKSRRTDC